MKGLDRLMFGVVLILVGIGMVLVGLHWPGRTEAAPVAATPEEAVKETLQAAHRGQYQQAALFFEGGRQVWEHSPTWVEQYLDRITDRGNALAFEVLAQGTHGEDRLLQLTTYTDQERTNPLRTMTWHFSRKGSGWVIRKVE